MSKIAASLPKKTFEESIGASAAQVEQTLTLVRTLIGSLPPSEQERFYREAAEKIRSATAPRAGELLGTILRLLPQQREWSVSELKQQVDAKGVDATDKELYNAIGYLTRKGRVRRIGYGRYLVDGMLLETLDELGGETARHEDAYRVDRGTE